MRVLPGDGMREESYLLRVSVVLTEGCRFVSPPAEEVEGASRKQMESALISEFY